MSSAEINGAGGGLEPADLKTELEHIREALRHLKFGTITIVVQDGVVVQIDRTERRRLRQPGGK